MPDRRLRILVAVLVVLLSLPFLAAGLGQYRATRSWMAAREACAGEANGRALRAFDRAYASLRWNPWFVEDYVQCLEGADRIDRAIEIYEPAVGRRAHPYALERLARLYFRTGSLDQAIAAAELASRMLPWRLTSKWQLATYHKKNGNDVQARAYARELLRTPVKTPSPAAVVLRDKARMMLAGEPPPEPAVRPK